MHSRRTLLAGTVTLGLTALLPAVCRNAAAAETAKAPAAGVKGKDGAKAKGKPARLAPLSVTAITEVFGEGQKLTAVTLEYPESIDTTALDVNSFGVRTRRIRRIYANGTGLPSEAGENGRFVVIELSPKDATALLYTVGRTGITRRPAAATVMQKGRLVTAAGADHPPSTETFDTTAVRNLVVDDFQSLAFKSGSTGETLAYNLFIPRDYDPKKRYPLVLFMHDAGANSTVVDTTLVQGLGATVWAGPADQAKHACFVLAPQYPMPVVDDQFKATAALETTVDLVKDLTAHYSIDPNRLYATGQSGGAMLAIAINLRHPGLFAANLLVAGPWDPAKIAPLAKTPTWFVVAEGDSKAFPATNGMLSVLEQQGTKISRAVWDGRWTADKFAEAVTLIEAPKAPVNCVVLKKGTVVPPGFANDAGANHVNTWRIAYGVEGIRDWLFQQKKA